MSPGQLKDGFLSPGQLRDGFLSPGQALSELESAAELAAALLTESAEQSASARLAVPRHTITGFMRSSRVLDPRRAKTYSVDPRWRNSKSQRATLLAGEPPSRRASMLHTRVQ